MQTGGGNTEQSVGSLILVDTIIANTPNGVITTILQENSTSLLLQNVVFANVAVAVKETAGDRAIVEGVPGGSLTLKSWGFGMVSAADGTASFINGKSILAMNRTSTLTIEVTDTREKVRSPSS